MPKRFISEDDGATLICNECHQDVRSNEAHDCKGKPVVPPIVIQWGGAATRQIVYDDLKQEPSEYMFGTLEAREAFLQAIGEHEGYFECEVVSDE